MDTISVIVPAYNIGPYLSRSLDSLLAQTYQNLEIIVVDDGSSDNTAAVMREYAGKSDRIRTIFKENGGVTSARLRGVQEATGDWIAFMDGDDYVEPQMYARLLENAQSCGADISHCGHQVHYSDGRIEYVHQSGKIHTQDHRLGLWELLDNRDVSMSLCTKLYRRRLFEGLENWMDTSIRNNEDLLMNYYLFDRAETGVLRETVPITTFCARITPPARASRKPIFLIPSGCAACFWNGPPRTCGTMYSKHCFAISCLPTRRWMCIPRETNTEPTAGGCGTCS